MGPATRSLRVAVIGASGYTGAELIRLLSRHPATSVVALTADRKAGRSLAAVFPHLAAVAGDLAMPPLTTLAEVDWSGIDVAFFALPHGATHAVAARAPQHVKLIDLSPDFRFTDPDTFSRWYGLPHGALALQREAVYGLSELARVEITGARLVACPGCYPTAALLPLIPLVTGDLIAADEIIIDAKSGVSGAGRALKEGSLYAEVAEGVHAYGVAGHRHAPEIEQAISRVGGRPVIVNFTPHLMPMNRGILASIYVRLNDGVGVSDLRARLEHTYAGEPFVRILGEGLVPATRHVRGSNHALIGVFADRLPRRAIVLSVIDNLVKGASGQAVQNMNLMCGLAETAGLEQQPLFP